MTYLNGCGRWTEKGSLLLEFRRALERLTRENLILAVRNIYDNKIITIRPEDMVFYLDKKYYSSFVAVSFMDIFKIETNDFKKIFWNSQALEPHIGLILNYIQSNYNTTYRFFRNRNADYHTIYSFLYDNYEPIKELLTILNAYHYTKDLENLQLYNVGYQYCKEKIDLVIQNLKNVKNFCPKFDK